MEIYTDGSARPNPGPGGSGIVIIKNNELIAKISIKSESITTNNQMELNAVICAFDYISKNVNVDLFTDSQYVQKGLTEWSNNWIKNGWKTSTNEPVKNAEQWKKLIELRKNFPLVKIKWIKAHNGHIWNTLADELAGAWSTDL
jgi:ribonuclease HI